MSFGSRRGLSTYERHAHPAFRNIERRRADHREHEKGKNWTVEEVTLLKGLWELYKGRKHTNKEINKFLTNETIDQIKYQKKKLNLFGEGSSQEVTSLATEGGGCGLVNSGNAHVEEVLRIQENINNEEFVRKWRLLLENEIDKPTEVPPVLRAIYQWLMGIWAIHKWLNEVLIERIDHFICTSLYETILNLNKNQMVSKIISKSRTNKK